MLFLDTTSELSLEGSVTFTESPPPLPATPGAYSKGSHLDTENLLTAWAENNTVYFHFFLQSSAETMSCDATASGADPTAMRRSHGMMKERFNSRQLSVASPRRSPAASYCFLLGSATSCKTFFFKAA